MTTHDTTTSADEHSQVLNDLLLGRWSCRAYEDRPASRETIERLLTMAQRSASWCNTQPWEVIVTSGKGTESFRSALQAYATDNPGKSAPEFDAPSEYRGIYRKRRRESGWQLYDALSVQKGDRVASAKQAMENFRLFGAPHVAIITSDVAQSVYGAIDCGLYIGTFLLAARSLGLGAIPQAAVAMQAPLVRKHFDIPDDRRIVVGISFGYPDLDHPANSYRTNRASLDEVVTWVN